MNKPNRNNKRTLPKLAGEQATKRQWTSSELFEVDLVKHEGAVKLNNRADPAKQGQIWNRKAHYQAGLAVMATFQGFGSQIQELKLQQPSEWTIEEAPGEIVVQNPDPGATKDVAKVKLLMKAGDLTGARKVALRRVMREMAGFSAYNRLEPWENWADERLQEWNIDVICDQKEVERWEDLRPNDWSCGVGASIRIARVVYPPSIPMYWTVRDTWDLYILGCQWADEVFGDERVWKAVNALAIKLTLHTSLSGEEVRGAIDGQDGTLDYLMKLADTKKWRERFGPK